MSLHFMREVCKRFERPHCLLPSVCKEYIGGGAATFASSAFTMAAGAVVALLI
jgi:hypothetical protein